MTTRHIAITHSPQHIALRNNNIIATNAIKQTQLLQHIINVQVATLDGHNQSDGRQSTNLLDTPPHVDTPHAIGGT